MIQSSLAYASYFRLSPRRPRELFQRRAAGAPPWVPTYDVTAHGQRFLINSELEAEGPPAIMVVMNWARGN